MSATQGQRRKRKRRLLSFQSKRVLYLQGKVEEDPKALLSKGSGGYLSLSLKESILP